jgi:cytoskeletal protein RodZ
MSTSISASGKFASHHRRRSSRKAFPNHVLGSAAVVCLVLGCAWNLHVHVFGASVYPTMADGNVDAPAIKRSFVVAAVEPARVSTNLRDALPEPAPVIAPPLTVASISPLDFNDRFGAAARQSVEPRPQAEAPKLASTSPPVEARKPADASKLASVSAPAEASKPKHIAPQPAPSKVASLAPATDAADAIPAKGAGASVKDMAQRAKAAIMSIASGGKSNMVEKLWGREPPHGSLLSYASADVSATGSLPREQNPMLGGSAPYDRSTAVYDIAARKVYLPDGTVLEAHSGLGSKLDDVRFAHVRMQGVTPPHIYELTPREALFHGVPALRLTPIGGEDKIFGRSGLLAHTYMLGPNGDSNGCVSFKDYYAFLDAYRNRGIKRLAVVARID